MGQTELDGYGRVLWQAKDVWPGFISCVLAVHEDAIRDHRADIQRLVNGIAASGKWMDKAWSTAWTPRSLFPPTITTKTRACSVSC